MAGAIGQELIRMTNTLIHWNFGEILVAIALRLGLVLQPIHLYNGRLAILNPIMIMHQTLSKKMNGRMLMELIFFGESWESQDGAMPQ